MRPPWAVGTIGLLGMPAGVKAHTVVPASRVSTDLSSFVANVLLTVSLGLWIQTVAANINPINVDHPHIAMCVS